MLLAHGTDDGVVPVGDLARLAAARRAARPDAVTETHRRSPAAATPGSTSSPRTAPRSPGSWPGASAARSRPEEAAAIAEAVPAVRLPDPERLDDARRGARRPPVPDPLLRRRGPAAPDAGPARSEPSNLAAPPTTPAARSDPMNVWDAVRTKRAVREFADRPDRARGPRPDRPRRTRAHSSKNQQRWAFVVVQDRERLDALSKARARTPGTSRGRPRRSRS